MCDLGSQCHRTPGTCWCPVDDDDLRGTRFGERENSRPPCAARAYHAASATCWVESEGLAKVVEQTVTVTALGADRPGFEHERVRGPKTPDLA
jgi:hypothetical protein